jgi:glycosyltransferase involved in cell wall biosynthesis
VRVCFLIDDLAAAGTESQLVALVRRLDRSRVLPYLVLLRGDNAVSHGLLPDCCPCLRLGVGSLKHPSTALKSLRFLHFLWRERIDVVQTYFPDSSYFGIVAGWLAGVPHRIRTRNNIGHWLTPAHRQLGRALNLLTTATVANCHAAREALLDDEKPPSRSVIVLENGVDLERFLDIALPGESALRVGAVANLRHIKGLDVLVAAAAMVTREFPEATFHVAGEGPERATLQSAIRELGIAPRFHLHGAVADIPGFLAGLDVAVLPSRAEGMSNAVLEYMAAGRPLVATAVGATPEVIRDGVDGLLVPPGDAPTLANAIARLLRDRPLARKLAVSARRRASEQYSRAAMVRRFEEFYTGLIAPTHPGDATCQSSRAKPDWSVNARSSIA